MLLLKVITQLHAWTNCRKCLKIFVLLHAQSNMNKYLFLKWLILTVNIYQNFSGTKYSTCSFMWCRSWCSAIPDVLFSKSKRDHVFLFHRPIFVFFCNQRDRKCKPVNIGLHSVILQHAHYITGRMARFFIYLYLLMGISLQTTEAVSHKIGKTIESHA